MDHIDKRIVEIISKESLVNPSFRIQQEFSITRQAVTKRLKKLQTRNIIDSVGRGRAKKYSILAPTGKTILNGWFKIEDIAERGEDRIFSEELLPLLLDRNKNTEEILSHIVTEMLNNVMDHSKGAGAKLNVVQNSDNVVITIEDDGIGVFESLYKGFNLEHLDEAVTELLKGKRTTDPKNHAGEGLFFSMRLADLFYLDANQIRFVFDAIEDDYAIQASPRKMKSRGTEIGFSLNNRSSRNIREVFEKYTNEDFEFSRNRPFVVKPYTIAAKGSLISRSEAKRFIAGAEGAELIVVDFKDVETVGQGFADQVFRVWATEHFSVQIQFKNANPFVEFMIKRSNPSTNVIKS